MSICSMKFIRMFAVSRLRTVSIAFGLSLVSFSVNAEDPLLSIEGGSSYMGGFYAINQSAPAIFGEVVLEEHAIGNSAFTWSPDVVGGWIDGRDIERYNASRYTTTDHIWMLAGGLRFHYGTPSAWYKPLFFSFQPTLHSGRTQALSSSYEFTSTVGWQAQHWVVCIRHSSNGFLHMPNRGETMVIVGLSFRL